MINKSKTFKRFGYASNVPPLSLVMLMLIILFMTAFGNEVSDGDVPLKKGDRSALCEKIRLRSGVQGFISARDRVRYCDYGCSFTTINCDVAFFEEPLFDEDFVKVWSEKLHTLMNNSLSYEESMFHEDILVSPESYNLWLIFVYKAVPMCLPFISYLISRGFDIKGFAKASALHLLFLSLNFMFRAHWPIFVHNLMFSLCCMLCPPKTYAFEEASVSLVFFYAILLMILQSNEFIQFGACFCFIVGWLAFIKHTYTTKRSGPMINFVLALFQIWTLVDILNSMIKNYSIKHRSMSLILGAFNSVVPNGPSKFFLRNAAVYSSRFASTMPTPINQIGIFVLFELFQVILFLLVRAFTGSMYIYALRYKFDFDSLVKGLFVYTIDIFGPIKMLWRIVIREEQYDTRKVVYGIFGVVTVLFELNKANEFFLLRIVFFSLDMFIIKSQYTRLARFLSCPVELNMNYADFPKPGANSWFALETLTNIANNVHRVHVITRRGTNCKACGMFLASFKKSMFVTAYHVVADAVDVIVNGKTLVQDPVHLGKGHDPVVGIKVVDEVGVDISILSENEIKHVDSIYTIVIREDDGFATRLLTNVKDFKIYPHDIEVQVNLRKGDSGGPVFAVLKDGTVRYCGCVSRGTFDEGSGNFFSLAVAKDKDLDDLSSEDGEPPDDVINASKVQPKVCFLYYTKCKLSQIEQIFDLRDQMFNDKLDAKFDELAASGISQGILSQVELDQGQRKKEDKKQDKKRQYKDRAMKKRGFLYASSFPLTNGKVDFDLFLDGVTYDIIEEIKSQLYEDLKTLVQSLVDLERDHRESIIHCFVSFMNFENIYHIVKIVENRSIKVAETDDRLLWYTSPKRVDVIYRHGLKKSDPYSTDAYTDLLFRVT